MLPHKRDRSYGRLKIIVCGRHRRSAELTQVGHAKILSFGVGDRGVLQTSTGARRKWSSGSSVLNPPLSALRGFVAAARFSCYFLTTSKMLHKSH